MLGIFVANNYYKMSHIANYLHYKKKKEFCYLSFVLHNLLSNMLIRFFIFYILSIYHVNKLQYVDGGFISFWQFHGILFQRVGHIYSNMYHIDIICVHHMSMFCYLLTYLCKYQGKEICLQVLQSRV